MHITINKVILLLFKINDYTGGIPFMVDKSQKEFYIKTIRER